MSNLTRKIINCAKAPKAIGSYSQGIEAGGTYYFSGMLGLDPETMQLRESFSDQLQQVLNNIDALLASQGLERKHIIKTTIFMTDLKNFADVNTAYEKFFMPPYPARSTVQVSALPKGAQIEIEVIAGS